MQPGTAGAFGIGHALDAAHARDCQAARVLIVKLAERLRQDDRTRRIPLIFLSGEVARADVQRARALGALAYLTKPFDPHALAAFVAHELAAARAGPSELTATVVNWADPS